MGVPQFGIANLVNIIPISLVLYGRYTELLHGDGKPTNITRGPGPQPVVMGKTTIAGWFIRDIPMKMDDDWGHCRTSPPTSSIFFSG